MAWSRKDLKSQAASWCTPLLQGQSWRQSLGKHNVQSKTNIHLCMWNSSSSRACISSITFRAASNRFMFLPLFSLLKIWISRVMRPGQTDRKSLLSETGESRMKRIRMQKRMRIRSAGEGFSSFMTSLSDSSTVRSLLSYLSTRPAYMMKQMRSKLLIFRRVASAFFVKMPSNSPSFDRS